MKFCHLKEPSGRKKYYILRTPVKLPVTPVVTYESFVAIYVQDLLRSCVSLSPELHGNALCGSFPGTQFSHCPLSLQQQHKLAGFSLLTSGSHAPSLFHLLCLSDPVLVSPPQVRMVSSICSAPCTPS